MQEDEINLLDYWMVIWKRKVLIIMLTFLTVLFTAVYSLRLPEIYQSKAVITPIGSKDSGGGGLSLLAQFGGIPGIAIPGSSSAAEIVNLMKSNILREKVIERYELLPILFYESWDKEKKQWKKDGNSSYGLNPLSLLQKASSSIKPRSQVSNPKSQDNSSPTVWDGLRMLDGIVKVNNNIKDNTITVSAEFYDPEIAANIVNYFLASLIDHMSGEAKRIAKTNKRYLEEQLGTTMDPIIRQKIYNLIAQQVETSMMSEVKENFAFKVIDPPKVPDKRIKPKRSQKVMLSFVTSLFASIFLAFFLEYIEKIKRKQT